MTNLAEIKHTILINKEYNLNINFNGNEYLIKFIPSDDLDNINIPSILLIPLCKNINNQILMEANNMESEDLGDLLKQGCDTLFKLVFATKDYPCPILIPLIPSIKNGPYYQQLSYDSFSNKSKSIPLNNKIENIINKSKNTLLFNYGIDAKEKILLNGYSSSGVFAQRFCLLNPNLVENAIIGGAIGSIPIPSSILKYPLGINDYEKLFDKKFNLEEYKKIKFFYYVGEFENIRKTKERLDDDNNYAPMHDMSYYDRSISKDIGKKQRDLLGKDMFIRSKNTIKILQDMGIDIDLKIINGRAHNNFIDFSTKIHYEGINEKEVQYLSILYNKINKKDLDKNKS